MAASNYLQVIGSVPLFAGCSDHELELVARLADEVRVDAATEMVHEGTLGHEAYVILEGEVVVKKGDREIARLGPGETFGELALLDGGPRTASVITTKETTLLVIGRREFVGLIDEVPGLARKLLANLASRIRNLDDRAFG